MTRTLGFFTIAVMALLGQGPTADEVLEHLEKSLEGINDYTVHLQASVDMEGLQVPSMTVTMYFKAPNKIHFESSTFAMLPREGLAFNPADLRKQFRGEGLAGDTVDGIPTAVVRLFPLAESSRRRPLTLWVDTSRWVVLQLRSQPFEGRRIVARFSYSKVEGKYWLPETLVVNFETSVASPDKGESVPQTQVSPRRGRAPLREGTIRVVYSDYAINTGLKDDLFEERKERP